MNAQIESSQRVVFLKGLLQTLHADLTTVLRDCTAKEDRNMKGYFTIDPPTITLCTNHIATLYEMETILVHEMVHLLDYQRGKEIDKNPEDLLASEFRAAYYGDCYQKSKEVSFLRRRCILKSGLMNAKNVMNMDGVDYRSVYKRCMEETIRENA
ncbi:hypothetical protein WA577_002125, partial [Blastocystis sp. JDR]